MKDILALKQIAMLQAAAAERERLSIEAAQSRLLCKARARQVANLEKKLNEQVSCSLCGGALEAIAICMFVLVLPHTVLELRYGKSSRVWQQRCRLF